MNFTQAKETLDAIGIRLTKVDGEYRVAFKRTRAEARNAEPSAYYTTDLRDAVSTGTMMAGGKL